jgi:hypothetical protein
MRAYINKACYVQDGDDDYSDGRVTGLHYASPRLQLGLPRRRIGVGPVAVLEVQPRMLAVPAPDGQRPGGGGGGSGELRGQAVGPADAVPASGTARQAPRPWGRPCRVPQVGHARRDDYGKVL